MYLDKCEIGTLASDFSTDAELDDQNIVKVLVKDKMKPGMRIAINSNLGAKPEIINKFKDKLKNFDHFHLYTSCVKQHMARQNTLETD